MKTRTVTVDSQFVHFGPYCCVSHESILGSNFRKDTSIIYQKYVEWLNTPASRKKKAGKAR